MDCQEAQLYFLEYLRGDLSDDLQKQIEEHLKKDMECQEHFEEMRATWEEMQSIPLAMPDASLSLDFHKMLEEEIEKNQTSSVSISNPPVKEKVISLWKYSAVAASIILILLSTWIVWKVAFDWEEPSSSQAKEEIAISGEKTEENKSMPSEEITTEELQEAPMQLREEQESVPKISQNREQDMKGEITLKEKENLVNEKPTIIPKQLNEKAKPANAGIIEEKEPKKYAPKTQNKSILEIQGTPDIRIQNTYNSWKENKRYNTQLIKQWFYQLNNDSNPNVRLVTIDVLYSFGEEKEVQNLIVNSLNLQSELLVQIAILEFILEFEIKAGKKAVQQLLQRKDLHQSLRSFAEIALQKIS